MKRSIRKPGRWDLLASLALMMLIFVGTLRGWL